MKTTLLALCVAVVLLPAASTIAHADEQSWVVKLTPAEGGTVSVPHYSGSAVWAQTSTSALVRDDPQIRDPLDGGPLPPNVQLAPQAAWYRPNWVMAAPYPWANTVDVRQPLTTSPNLSKPWDDLIVWVPSGYTGTTLHLLVGTPAPDSIYAASALPSYINGQTMVYTLVMTWHPAAYTGPTIFNVPTRPVVPEDGTWLTLADITLPLVEGVMTSNPISATGPLAATQSGGYQFSFVTSAVPEPGGWLVMAGGLPLLVALLPRRREQPL